MLLSNMGFLLLYISYTLIGQTLSNFLFVLPLLLQAGFVTDPAPVADRVNFDYAAYPDSQNTIGPVSAIYYIASAPAAQ